MRKIPTVFKRDPENMRRVLPEVTPGCEWVLAGEGVATRKYDGTCCMFSPGETLSDEGCWYTRREVKPGKPPPENFVAIETDENTGKTVGWQPIDQSGYAKWHKQAVEAEAGDYEDSPRAEGTYELCGPKVNGNPERYLGHVLIAHREAVRIPMAFAENYEGVPGLTYLGLRSLLSASFPFEGIVWHHPDGRMAKLKRRDFT